MQGFPFISRVVSVLLTCSILQQNVCNNVTEGEREGFFWLMVYGALIHHGRGHGGYSSVSMT